MNILLVLPNFRSFELGFKEEGEYILILPQTQSYLWSHLCSSVWGAFYKLARSNREEILNQMFGENNYKLELYKFTDTERFNKDCEKINKSNTQIDLDKLKKLKERYGE